jgi:hypothetical protein
MPGSYFSKNVQLTFMSYLIKFTSGGLPRRATTCEESTGFLERSPRKDHKVERFCEYAVRKHVITKVVSSYEYYEEFLIYVS